MKNLQTLIINLFAILIIGSATANAATWTVTKSTNSNDNVCDTDCSLREAVFNADSGDTVVFSPNLLGQTITLGGSEIVITKRITIDGYLNNPNVAFVSGENTSRIFYIPSGGGLTLRNMTLVQGNGKGDVGNTEGGAIFVYNAALSLDRVSLRGNIAKYSGAVALYGGTHHFTNSSFTGNTAQTNTAFGIRFGATLYMSNTTVSGNNYLIGDGDTLGAGAIFLQGSSVILRNATIVNNSAKNGGGIAYAAGGGASIIDIGNTIVAGNTATEIGQDIRAGNVPITSRGGNLIQNTETVPDGTFNKPNDITGVNPLLAPINSNQGGFPVDTHPLQAGSPARNGGLNANAVDPLTNQPLATDARGAGFPRIADTTVDIGAFEDQTGNTSLIVTKLADTNDLVCDTDCSLREAVHTAGLNFGTDTITFAPNVFGTITLGGTEIPINNQSVNIVGYTKANTLTVSGGDKSRIFKLNNATVNISGLTLTDGKVVEPNGLGGAILGSSSNLTLDRLMIAGNDAYAYPAFYLDGGSTQRITNSTISGNSAESCIGIGIKATSLFMSNTTISGNFDSNGGNSFGAVCTFKAALTIRNSTIAFNRLGGVGSSAGGIFVNDSTLNIGNSIVAQNLAGFASDIQLGLGSITSVGGNLIGDPVGFPAGTFNQTNDATGVDPMLGALADNGGNVTTLALAPNSPAINTGINGNAVDPFDSSALPFDARGTISRILGAAVDKGAFESIVSTAATVSVSGRLLVNGRGLAKAQVFYVDTNGKTYFAQTNSFGFYNFKEVEVGETYVFSVSSKKYTFEPKVVNVTEEIADLDFTLKR